MGSLQSHFITNQQKKKEKKNTLTTRSKEFRPNFNKNEKEKRVVSRQE